MKNKFQSYNFKSVEEFLEFLPPDELQIVEYLRGLIFKLIPGVTEKLNYNVPFYKRNKNILFIWPASVLWGNKKSYSGVRLGFTNGYLLNDEINYLDKGERKQVYYKDFSSVKEIEVDVLKTYLFESIKIDEKLSG